MGKFDNKRIVLGVAGSIAAYKAVSLLRTLVEEGAEVSVVMTLAAKQFVTPLTFEVLSKRSVSTDLFSESETMPHLRLTESADLVLVAPATANTLAKSALGLADDLLSTMILAARCPLIFAPAMDGEMWDHPSVMEHTQVLRGRGVTVMEPEDGPLASGQVGRGRLPSEEAILNTVAACLSRQHDWAGQRVLVSAGPTREPIDAIRFITNGSSGKMGYAIAQAAAHRGAQVLLVSGPTNLPSPANCESTSVVTAEEMQQALEDKFSWATVLIMTAAVGDFRSRVVAPQKLKKDEWAGESLDLERTPDILASLSKQKTHQILVGFAAETENHVENGRKKLHQKTLDLVAVNHISGPDSAFGNDMNELTILTKAGEILHLDRAAKPLIAHRLLDVILPLALHRALDTPRISNLRSL
ncbi:bifunctional phosphopantothenoylcysteine decarboxylase/phosphopantothenate--cysteine ligase CoaBC [Candidatus Nitronereus thalassa]|uniref:Coenzyme A biosynthesis bifunctional protein CoaBC n=1 Tax=Candidatus Nitronereus thalassa TaxID=3020898 RepID=A0ABU3K6J7_9BACT|nr:bifunctional phosphopantothenoylcysteine decarboxylase/phosphopantothenate--cysteine ligase CoaBC [Candidatus Nitronereus thalassa]MDT7042042.1 bifunctional phosphopantothenoylcysteine decarboxylase/phosphopantothenate--cysteine ligase CoaBC [Candidatus Nitronereus thalassa]